MELDTADSKRSMDEACIEVTLSEDRQPVPNGMRTAHQDTDLERPIMRDVAGHVVEASDEVVGSQPADRGVVTELLACFGPFPDLLEVAISSQVRVRAHAAPALVAATSPRSRHLAHAMHAPRPSRCTQ